jgi:hypothetical protein
MKEVFTKSFWKDVKKTFDDAQKSDDAQDDRPPADKPAEAPSVSSEQQTSPDSQ